MIDCPADCKICKSAETELDKNGVCTKFCSKYGYCGESENYQAHGHDCRKCGGKYYLEIYSSL